MGEIKNLVKKIKQKKELSGIEEAIILDNLKSYLNKNRISLEKLNPNQLKLVVKDVRSSLREKVGRFQASAKNRYNLLEKDDIKSLLKTHSSTKERIAFYPQFIEIINKLKAKSILDLGCGINPLALAKPGIKYYASDINLEDLNIVRIFFQKHKIDGKVFLCDLNKIENCDLPEADLAIILKVFDILGDKEYETAKKVLEKIKSPHLIASFSTITLSGKRMHNQRRIWFEKLLNFLLYKFEIVKSDNEIFYIM